MKSVNDNIIFANSIVGFGAMNGNVNLSLGAYLFSPSDDGKKIEPDLAIVGRIRMDEPCARQLLKNLLDLFGLPEPVAAETNGMVPVEQEGKTVN